MAGVSVQDIELVYHPDRPMLSDVVSPIEKRLPWHVAGLQAFHQINRQSVIFLPHDILLYSVFSVLL